MSVKKQVFWLLLMAACYKIRALLSYCAQILICDSPLLPVR